jgi:hypothetical protein
MNHNQELAYKQAVNLSLKDAVVHDNVLESLHEVMYNEL